MEKYCATCRLILCCNSSTRVIPAIRSRCLAVRVAAPTNDEVTATTAVAVTAVATTNAIALHVFVTVTVKLQQFVMNEPDFSPLEQGSNWRYQLRLSSLYL